MGAVVDNTYDGVHIIVWYRMKMDLVSRGLMRYRVTSSFSPHHNLGISWTLRSNTPVPHNAVSPFWIDLNIWIVQNTTASDTQNKSCRTSHYNNERVHSWVTKPCLLAFKALHLASLWNCWNMESNVSMVLIVISKGLPCELSFIFLIIPWFQGAPWLCTFRQ